jgi:Arc/MetJ-type ribon-helix-helix transcriptional regulator
MSARSARLNVRVPQEDLLELEAIRERAGHGSVSDVVRDAIACYLGEEASSWNSETVKATIPAALAEDLEMFIASGDASDLSQAVTLALTAWVEDRKRYYLEGKEAVRRKIAEAAEDRDTRKGMARVASRMKTQ